MADALDSKSSACNGRVGSTPTSGTIAPAHSLIKFVLLSLPGNTISLPKTGSVTGVDGIWPSVS